MVVFKIFIKNFNYFKLIFINCSTKFSNIHNVLRKYGIKEQIPCLFVFDDLMFLSDVKDNWSKLHNYVTKMKDCHHSNCSLIFVCQAAKASFIQNGPMQLCIRFGQANLCSGCSFVAQVIVGKSTKKINE